jgi:phospholipase/lecithinase/hemolysin
MKKILKTIAFIAGVVLILSACDDYNKLTAPTVDTGNANFSRFVTIGNSLTAGYLSGSLFETAQKYSYGKLIANQLGTSFEQPLVGDPGTGGRLEIESLSPFTLSTNPNAGAPLNLTYPAPYNNLGVPGAFVYDVLNATNSSNNFTAVFAGVPNPMFDLILRNSALNIGTQFQQAAALDPTFVTLWIGNNDVLGFATSGGTKPAAPTDVPTFTALYTATGGAIASLGAQVVVGNIPDVASIPFFTTVGPQMALGVPWSQLALLGVPGLFYQEHGNTGPSMTVFADSLTLLTGGVLVTLKGSSYASLVGTPTGKFYTDFGFPGLPPGIDTTQAFGVHPQNPWPDALILDPGEIITAKSTVDAYNGVISSVADANGFGLVDFNTFFKGIRASDFAGGTVIDGITFKTFYVSGGLFSLDGVHPTSQGQAIMANEFIKVINSKFSANIPLVNVAEIPGSLNFTGKISFDKKGYAIFSKDAFDHLLF